MDIDPQAVIDALSQKIGALQTENTILKMALSQVQAEAAHLSSAIGLSDGAEEEEEPKQKKK